MAIQIKLYSMLRLKYKGYNSVQGITVEYRDNTRIKDLLAQLGIDENDVGMVIINQRINRETDTEVHENDTIHLFSHIPSGG